jgi:Calcineurin-like phosphoesterase
MTLNELKIGIISDLHLDHKKFTGNLGTGDILMIPGDVIPAALLHPKSPVHAEMIDRTNQVFERGLKSFDHVVYTMGNHEHDYGVINYSKDILEKYINNHPNLHMLEKEKVIIKNLPVFGGVFWTDFYDGNPLAMMAAQSAMPEYKMVSKHDSNGMSIVTPEDIYREHIETIENLNLFLDYHRNQPVAVMSHHLPSYKSVNSKFRAAKFEALNTSFYSNLDYIMEENDNIILWAHGHTHDNCEYKINKTDVYCNPRGYSDQNKHFNPGFIRSIFI